MAAVTIVNVAAGAASMALSKTKRTHALLT